MDRAPCRGTAHGETWSTDGSACGFCPDLQGYNATVDGCGLSAGMQDGGHVWSCSYGFARCEDANRWQADLRDGGSPNCQLQETGTCLKMNTVEGNCCALSAQLLHQDAGCLAPMNPAHDTYACFATANTCSAVRTPRCFQETAPPTRVLVFAAAPSPAAQSEYGLTPCDDVTAAAVEQLPRCN